MGKSLPAAAVVLKLQYPNIRAVSIFSLEMFSSHTLNPQASYLDISLTFLIWNPKHKQPQHGIKNFARLCLLSFMCQGTRDDKEILHAIKIGFLKGGGFSTKKDEVFSVICEAFIHRGYGCRSWFTLALLDLLFKLLVDFCSQNCCFQNWISSLELSLNKLDWNWKKTCWSSNIHEIRIW